MLGRLASDLGVGAQRFWTDQGFLLAAALSFSFLVCLAPLALLFFSAVGFLLASERGASAALEAITSLVPGYSAEVTRALALFTLERNVAGVLGTLGLVVFATPLFSLTRQVLNRAFRVARGRGLVHGLAFDLFALAVVALLGVTLSAAILTSVALGDVLLPLAEHSPLAGIRWARVLALPLLYAALLGLLFFVYRMFPKTGVSSRAAAAAALTVSVLWELARLGFGLYVTRYGVYGQLYGSFGVLVAGFAWVYYSSVIFVWGAELAALWTERAHSGIRAEAAQPGLAPAGPRRRPGGILPFAAAVALGALAVAVMAQNAAPVSLRFFAWAVDGVPLALALLAAGAAGALGAALLLGAWLWRREARRREAARQRGGPGQAGPEGHADHEPGP